LQGSLRENDSRSPCNQSFNIPSPDIIARGQFSEIKKTDYARQVLFKGDEVGQMMKVVGEEGTSLEDYIDYLKSEFFDSVFLQQNAFDAVDASTPAERQKYVFDRLLLMLTAGYDLADKETARSFFNQMRQIFLDWNGTAMDSDEFKKSEEELMGMLKGKRKESDEEARAQFDRLFGN